MLENLQVHTADVQKPLPTKGTSGAEKVTWSTTVTAMPCRVIDATPTWIIFYQQRQLNITHQVFTNQFPTIKAGYQLIWEGRTLRVVGFNDLGGASKVTRIDTQELVTGV